MKSILIPLLAIAAGLPTQHAPEIAPNDNGFDTFVELFHAALATGDPSIYSSFFSDSVRFVLPENTFLILSPEQTIAELSDLGKPEEHLAHLASGFVQLDTRDQLAFKSVHNSAPDHQFIKVTAKKLRFRSLPSSNAQVIALLDDGIYSGTTPRHGLVLCERSTGIEWIQVELELPTMGLVKGYVAADYIRLIPRKAPKTMRIDLVNGQWLITELSAL